MWSATDLAGNARVSTSAQQFRIDTRSPSIAITGTAEGAWYDGPKVSVDFTASDGHSGLLEVEYCVKGSGNTSFGKWLPLELKRTGDVVLEYNGTVALQLPEGPGNQVQFRARDVAGNDWSYSAIRTIRINAGQNASITAPVNNFTLKKGEMLQLSAGDAGSIDGDVLTYSWFSSLNGYLGNGTALSIETKKGLDAGTHVITLFVDDGHGHNVSASVSIVIFKPKVKPAEPGLNMMYIVIPLVVILVVVGVIAFAVLRRKRGATPPPAEAGGVVPNFAPEAKAQDDPAKFAKPAEAPAPLPPQQPATAPYPPQPAPDTLPAGNAAVPPPVNTAPAQTPQAPAESPAPVNYEYSPPPQQQPPAPEQSWQQPPTQAPPGPELSQPGQQPPTQ
jgi:hypothetical protein